MRIFLMYITFDLPLVWSSKQELSIACIHISTQFSMPCNYYVIKCICESFFLFFFSFLPFHFNFLCSWVSRAIFLAFHMNCAFSLTHSLTLCISLMQSGKRSSAESLSVVIKTVEWKQLNCGCCWLMWKIKKKNITWKRKRRIFECGMKENGEISACVLSFCLIAKHYNESIRAQLRLMCYN